MKIKVSKEKLLKGLQVVQSAVSAQATLPVLYNVLVKAETGKLILTVSDLTVTIRYSLEAEVKKGGESTLPAKRFVNIVRELPQDSLEMEIDDKNAATLSCGSSLYKILGISSDEFPPVPKFDGGHAFSMEQSAFKEMLKKTVYAVSLDESRHVLNGLLLCFKEQKLSIVATDGRRLALVEQEIEVPAGAEQEAVIPTKTVNELIRSLGDEGNVKLQISANMALFDAGEIQIYTKLIEGNYPNYRQVIPTRCEERVSLGREELLAALRRVALMASDKSNSIKVSFGKNLVAMSIVTPDVGEAHETVPAKYTGKEIVLAFNPEFIMDPLRNLTNDVVYIELTDAMSPAVLKCDIPFLYVLMPLRLN